MQEKDKDLFSKILDAIDKIEKFTEPIENYQQLLKEEMISDAVILNLIVIADMVSKISPEIRKNYPKITWEQVKQVEHNFTNNYIGIDIEYTWKIVSEYIPIFKRQLISVNL